METEWSGLYYHTFNPYRIYQYNSLCKESTDILDFPPHSSHFTVWNENKICNNLWKYIKIGAPFRISHGFIACNALPNTLSIIDSSGGAARISMDGIDDTKNAYHITIENKQEPLQIVTIRESPIGRLDTNSLKKNLYLLFGKIDQDGIVEGLAACRFKSSLFEWSFKSAWNRGSSFHTVLQHDRLNSNERETHGLVTECTFDKPEDGNIWIGTRMVYHFPRLDNIKFSTGGEVYYSIAEKTGATSLGVRGMFQDAIKFMTTWNPFMGHVSSHCCIQAGQFLQFATRYDYNYYSYESDVSVGLALQRPKLSDDIPKCKIGCRYTYSQGLAIQYMAQFTRSFSAGLIISSTSRRDAPIIGLSLHFST